MTGSLLTGVLIVLVPTAFVVVHALVAIGIFQTLSLACSKSRRCSTRGSRACWRGSPSNEWRFTAWLQEGRRVVAGPRTPLFRCQCFSWGQPLARWGWRLRVNSFPWTFRCSLDPCTRSIAWKYQNSFDWQDALSTFPVCSTSTRPIIFGSASLRISWSTCFCLPSSEWSLFSGCLLRQRWIRQWYPALRIPVGVLKTYLAWAVLRLRASCVPFRLSFCRLLPRIETCIHRLAFWWVRPGRS